MGFSSERVHARGRLYDALAVALDAGLTLDQAVATLAGSGEAVAAAMAPAVARGEPLSRAMAESGAFDDLERTVVEAGETAGRLPEVLRRLGRAFAVRGQARDRLTGALAYPLLLLHAAVLLPPLYRLVTGGLGDYLAVVLPIFLGLYGTVVLGVVLLRVSTASEPGKLSRDRLLFRLPKIGTAARALALADYAHAFAVLYAAGVPMPETLARAATATPNRVVRGAGRRIGERVRRGATLQQAFASERDAFPALFVQAVTVGEAAGKLEETLEKAAERAREDAERTTFTLVKTAGAVAYGVAALIVAWVVIRTWLGLVRLPDGL